jgi:hypothetical protein
VLEGAWIAPGAHVNAAGSNALQRAELDVAAVRRAGVVVTDSIEQARLECGDLVAALEQGAIRWRGDGGRRRRRPAGRAGAGAPRRHRDPHLTPRRLSWPT